MILNNIISNIEDPITYCSISNASHYAFVDFKTKEQVLELLKLKSVKFKDNLVTISTPKNNSEVNIFENKDDNSTINVS